MNLQWHYTFSTKQVIVIVDTWYFVQLWMSVALYTLDEMILVLIYAVLRGCIVTNSTAALLVQLLDDLLHLGHTLRQFLFVSEIL